MTTENNLDTDIREYLKRHPQDTYARDKEIADFIRTAATSPSDELTQQLFEANCPKAVSVAIRYGARISDDLGRAAIEARTVPYNQVVIAHARVGEVSEEFVEGCFRTDLTRALGELAQRGIIDRGRHLDFLIANEITDELLFHLKVDAPAMTSAQFRAAAAKNLDRVTVRNLQKGFVPDVDDVEVLFSSDCPRTLELVAKGFAHVLDEAAYNVSQLTGRKTGAGEPTDSIVPAGFESHTRQPNGWHVEVPGCEPFRSLGF